MPALISANTPLSDCPQWPTTQWLARPVATRLGKQVGRLRSRGIPARKSDVVAALVLGCSAASADELWKIVRPYKEDYSPPQRRHSGVVPMTIQLPSPISLRIDVFVETARELGVVYRHDIVGALIMEPRNLELLAPTMDRYQRAQARDAAVVGKKSRTVLRTETPDPGPRRWRPAREKV
jgi:hypothetical protein